MDPLDKSTPDLLVSFNLERQIDQVEMFHNKKRVEHISKFILKQSN